MSTFHVLVVDDEPDIRTLIKEILSDEGYKVINAGNAQEARMARQKNKFDLILLDIWMPDIDGISLLREWSEQGNLNCPVVIMSGHGTVDTAVKATGFRVFKDMLNRTFYKRISKTSTTELTQDMMKGHQKLKLKMVQF